MLSLQLAASTIKYDTLKLEQTETGFVEIYHLTGMSKSGKPYEAMACLIGTVEDGKIVRLDEFLNPAGLVGLASRMGQIEWVRKSNAPPDCSSFLTDDVSLKLHPSPAAVFRSLD